MHSPEWYIERRRGIGASEAAAVLGLDSRKKPSQVYLEKIGELEPDEGDALMQYGQRVEPVIAQIYAEETGRRIRRINRTVWHPTIPILFCHPDREVVRNSPMEPRRLLEIKFSGRAWEELPERVQVQVQHQMGVTGAGAVDVALFTPYAGFLRYEVLRDDLFIERLFRALTAWWRKHVEAHVPPLDDAAELARYLGRSVVDEPMIASPEQQRAMEELGRVQALAKQAEADELRLKNWLRFSMAGSTALRGQGLRLSWKPEKPRIETDYTALAIAAVSELPDETAAALVEEFTEEKEGRRPMRLYGTKEAS